MASFRFLRGLAPAIVLFAGAAHAGQPSWPRITQASDPAACRQALVVAKLAFGSSATKLADAAPAILKDRKPAFGILLAPDGAGNAEGGDFIVDDAAIERKDVAGDVKAVFLQRAPAGGFRFAVKQQKMNWQGDWYGFYVAQASLDADKLADLLTDEKQTAVKPVFELAWQRPWLVRDPESQEIVGIDTQHPAGFLEEWIVYRIAKGTATPACRIAFRPPVKHAVDLLPAGPLRRFAALLDDTIGVPAQDEGTLHVTRRVHLTAANAVANLALRPWAVAEPYNSAAEIAEGLKAWSHKSAIFRAQYRQVQALYPQALQALASYYRTALAKSPADASALAKLSLDRAVGAHFVFPKKG